MVGVGQSKRGNDNRPRQQNIHHKRSKIHVSPIRRRYFCRSYRRKRGTSLRLAFLKSGDQASGECCIHRHVPVKNFLHAKSTGHDSAQSPAQRTSDPPFWSQNAAKSLESHRWLHASLDNQVKKAGEFERFIEFNSITVQ